MAELGRGSAEFMQLDEDIEGAILQFQDKVAFPMLTDIQLDWKNCQVWDAYPAQLPDLYAGQSLQLSARLKRESQNKNASLMVKGMVGNHLVQYEMPLPVVDADFPEAARLWARTRVEDLLEQAASGNQPAHSIRQEIINLALEHRLLTPYTAFVALDSEIVNPSGNSVPLPVSQPLPKGLDWDSLRPNVQPMLPPAYAPSAAPMRFAKMMMETPAPMDDQLGIIDLSASVTSRRSSKRSEAVPLSPDSTISPGSIQSSIEPTLETAESTLRWLARTQELDGSWGQGIEFTAAALLAFVRNGQTILRGYYRKQVKKAADWLGKIPASGNDAYAQSFALFELGNIDHNEKWTSLAKTMLSILPAPATPFQQSVVAYVMNPDAVKTPIASTTDLDTIRQAAVAGTSRPVDPALITSDHSGLMRVWHSGIPKNL